MFSIWLSIPLNVLILLALGDMFRVNYTATYSEDGMLKEIVVKWEDVVS